MFHWRDVEQHSAICPRGKCSEACPLLGQHTSLIGLHAQPHTPTHNTHTPSHYTIIHQYYPISITQHHTRTTQNTITLSRTLLQVRNYETHFSYTIHAQPYASHLDCIICSPSWRVYACCSLQLRTLGYK